MRIAALDLGSNSFHLLVVEAHTDGSFRPLVREKEMLRLGDVVSRQGMVTEAALVDVIGSIRRLKALADAADADEIVAYATSAMRDAANGPEVVARIEEATGVAVEIISGRDEARLIFSAVKGSVLLEPAPALCLDLGGGSLELMIGDQRALDWATSVPLGVARLSAELVRNDPLTRDDVRRVRKRVLDTLSPLVEEVRRHRPPMMVGTSGTLSDLARMAASRNGPVPEAINQLRVRRKDLIAVHDRLLALPEAGRARIAGLEAKRADIVPAGAILLRTAMELFDQTHLTVGEWALREGMVIEAVERYRAHEPAAIGSIRRFSVLALARRCGYDEGHGHHVARLAVDLFDQTRRLHRLDNVDRELLEYGCLLHDIGEHVSVDAHHKHTAYLVQHGRLRGFSPDEVSMLATLGRFHRRSDPKLSFPPFESLGADGRRRATALVAILRLADGLDRGHRGNVEEIGVEVDLARRTVALELFAAATADAELERSGVERKAELFERVFDVRLDVSVEVPDRVAADGA